MARYFTFVPAQVTQLLVAISAPAFAQVTITRIADDSILFPGGVTMTQFEEPAIRGDSIIFSAQSPGGVNKGVYVWRDGSIHAVAVIGENIPESIENFQSFGRVSTDGTSDVFQGSSQFADVSGIYVRDGDTLGVLIDRSVPLPGDVGVPSSFPGFGRYGGDSIPFIAYGPSQQGVFVANDSGVTMIADTATVAPGDGLRFFSFERLISDQSDLAFLANVLVSPPNNFRQGVYAFLDGSLVQITAWSRPVPGDGGTFQDFLDVGLHREAVRVVGGPSNFARGIYEFSGNSAQALVGVNCRIPESTASGWNVQELTTEGADTVFSGGGTQGSTGNSYGLYLYRGGTITKLLADPIPFEGGMLSYERMGQQALSGMRVALLATYEQPPLGHHGVYLLDYSAVVPCPDITCDDNVDLADLAALLANFGQTSIRSLKGDIDGDGTVSLSDLTILLSQFGTLCP